MTDVKLTHLAVALAVLGYAVALAGSLLLSVASLDTAVVGATAVALLLGGVAALVATVKVAYVLGRYVTTDPASVDSVTSLPAGDHWVRVEGVARREGDPVEPPLSPDPAVAQSVAVREQETFSGLPWPRAYTHLVDATDARPFSVADGPFRFRFDADERVEVVDSWRDDYGETVGPGDDPPASLGRFLDRHGYDVDAHRSDGYLFDHALRVAEATVPEDGTVRLFGRVSVAEAGDAVEPRGEGLTAVVATTKPWRTIPLRYLRQLLWGLFGTVFLFAAGTFLLLLVTGVA